MVCGEVFGFVSKRERLRRRSAVYWDRWIQCGRASSGSRFMLVAACCSAAHGWSGNLVKSRKCAHRCAHRCEDQSPWKDLMWSLEKLDKVRRYLKVVENAFWSSQSLLRVFWNCEMRSYLSYSQSAPYSMKRNGFIQKKTKLVRFSSPAVSAVVWSCGIKDVEVIFDKCQKTLNDTQSTVWSFSFDFLSYYTIVQLSW